jgi:arylsulfatase
VSFAPILTDPTATTRDYAFSEHNWHVGQAHERSVRNGRWLYIRNSYPELRNECVESGPMYPAGKELWDAQAAGELNADQRDVFLQPRPTEELYDVAADPHQLRNLATARPSKEHSEAILRLRRALDRWVEETGDTVPMNRTPSAPVVGRGQGMGQHFEHGELPGAARQAETINAAGPIREGAG